MRTSGPGLELIRSFEGFRARATQLANGAWVIGFGHTDKARAGLKISRDDASLVLIHHDLPPIETAIREHVLSPLSQNEFDALASFVFNIGIDAFLGSDVLTHLNEGSRLDAAEAMTGWRRGRVGQELRVIDALVRRRAAEVALFLEHPSGRVTLPSALMRAEPDALPARAPRERAVIVDTRVEADRARPPEPAGTKESALRAATLAIRDRMARKLEADAPEAPPGDSTEPTPDEIRRAIQELAGGDSPEDLPQLPKTLTPPRYPEGFDRRRPQRPDTDTTLMPLDDEPARGPSGAPIVDDLDQVQPDPKIVERAILETEAVRRRPPAAGLFDGLSRWMPFALLSGLSAIGVATGGRNWMAQAQGALTDERALSAGPILAVCSALVLVMSLYYLFRALTGKD